MKAHQVHLLLARSLPRRSSCCIPLIIQAVCGRPDRLHYELSDFVALARPIKSYLSSIRSLTSDIVVAVSTGNGDRVGFMFRQC